jgi:hypothetical protein
MSPAIPNKNSNFIANKLVITETRKRLQDLQDALKPIVTAEEERRNPVFTYVQFTRSIQTAGFRQGELRLKTIIEDLDTMFPNGKFEFQKRLHSQVLRASLRQILGDNEYSSSVNRVCAQYGWDGPKQNVFVKASRRSGKTTGMAAAVAAILINTPEVKVVNFSGAKESATDFVHLVSSYIERINRGKSTRRVRTTQDRVIVQHNAFTESSVIAYPSGGRSYDVSFILFICLFFPERIRAKPMFETFLNDRIKEYVKNHENDQTTFEMKLGILSSVWQQLNQLIPDDVDCNPQLDGLHIASVIEALFPNGSKHIELRWLPDLLTPETVERFSVVVNQEHYDAIRLSAKDLESEPSLDEGHRTHLKRIADGHMPFGVFSEEHSRWKIIDCNEPEVVCNQHAVDQYMKK